jgi:hypothetical protein
MALTLVGGVIGPNVDEVSSGTTTTGAGAPQPLGTRITGVDGTVYVLVQAASTSGAMASVKAPNAYAILSTFRAKLVTSAQAAAGLGVGFAPPKVIVAHDFFWARVGGTGFTARVSAAASAARYLRTTTTAGRLGTASTASAVVVPAVITAVASSSTSAGNTVRTIYAPILAPLGTQPTATTLSPP